MQEGLHVFIKMGLDLFKDQQQVSILEMGLGTGLNFLLTAHNRRKPKETHYTALEAFPLTEEEWKAIGSPIQELSSAYQELHQLAWEELGSVADVKLLKQKTSLQEYKGADNQFDLIYYDAFGPRVQPELWTDAVFSKLNSLSKPGGYLVTYCAQGQVRRNMIAAGYTVEKLPGPPGKREMLRAQKPA